MYNVYTSLMLYVMTGTSTLILKFGHFLQVNVREPQLPSVFTEIYEGQLVTLREIEDEDGLRDDVELQVFPPPYFPSCPNFVLLLPSEHNGGHRMDI